MIPVCGYGRNCLLLTGIMTARKGKILVVDDNAGIRRDLPGIFQTSGSLGQGLSAACGLALGKKLDKDDNFVYCLCGDGESEEGQIWEAGMFAVFHKLDNLIAMTDWNGKQIDGPV